MVHWQGTNWLCFFADKEDVLAEEKHDMEKALLKSDSFLKRAQMQIKNVQNSQVADFVTGSTRNFFTRLEISQDFLCKDPKDWNKDASYIKVKSFLTKLQVVNDLAERGAALIEQYNRILTKDEEQKQLLLQVVEAHCRHFPDCSKNSLEAGLGHASEEEAHPLFGQDKTN